MFKRLISATAALTTALAIQAPAYAVPQAGAVPPTSGLTQVTPTLATQTVAIGDALNRIGLFVDDFDATHGGVYAGTTSADAALTALENVCVSKVISPCVVRWRPSGQYHISSAHLPANYGNAVTGAGPTSPNYVWLGLGGWADSGTAAYNPNNGTVISLDSQDMTHAGKLVLTSRSMFTARGITFKSGGTPVGGVEPAMIFRNNTNLDLDASDVIYGQGTNAQGSSCTDISTGIVAGPANTAPQYNGTETGDNQAYQDNVKGPLFYNVQHAVVIQEDVNGANWHIKIQSGCSPTVGDAAVIEADPNGGGPISNNEIAIDEMEISNWSYGINILSPTIAPYVPAIKAFDGSTYTLGAVHIGTGVTGGVVFEGLAPAGKPYLVDDNTRTASSPCPNTFITKPGTGSVGCMPGMIMGSPAVPNQIYNTIFPAGPLAYTVQPLAPAGTGILWNFLRSAAETVDPGGQLFAPKNDGSLILGGEAGAGNIINSLASGGSWTSNGKYWGSYNGSARQAGGTYTIDTGSGGSPLKIYAYSLNWYKQDGATQQISLVESAAGSSAPGIVFGSGQNDAIYDYYSGGGLSTNVPMRIGVYTVSTLPTCNSSTMKGATATVTDATSPSYHGALTGGGTATVQAICAEGSAWLAD